MKNLTQTKKRLRKLFRGTLTLAMAFVVATSTVATAYATYQTLVPVGGDDQKVNIDHIWVDNGNLDNTRPDKVEGEVTAKDNKSDNEDKSVDFAPSDGNGKPQGEYEKEDTIVNKGPNAGDVTAPGEDEGTTPDEGEGTTPGEDEGTTPGEGEGTTPDEDEGTTPGEDEGTTSDEDKGTEPPKASKDPLKELDQGVADAIRDILDAKPEDQIATDLSSKNEQVDKITDELLDGTDNVWSESKDYVAKVEDKTGVTYEVELPEDTKKALEDSGYDSVQLKITYEALYHIVNSGSGGTVVTDKTSGKEVLVKRTFVSYDNGKTFTAVEGAMKSADGGKTWTPYDPEKDYKEGVDKEDEDGAKIKEILGEEYDPAKTYVNETTYTFMHVLKHEESEEPEKTNVTVRKVWDDENNKDGIRPQSVTIEVYQNGELFKTAELNEANGWQMTYEDLDAKDAEGNPYNYTVKEPNVAAGYESIVSGTTVTNRHIPFKPEKTNVTVRKVWDDENNKDGIRPQSVTIEVYQNGKLFKTAELNEANGWQMTYEDLDAKDAEGNPYNYTVKEPNVAAGYESIVSGTTVTNRHVPKEDPKEDPKKDPPPPDDDDDDDPPPPPRGNDPTPPPSRTYVEIPDEPVPMSSTPRLLENYIEILDDEVPLAGLPSEPGTGIVSHRSLWAVIFAASLGGLLLLLRKDEEEAA